MTQNFAPTTVIPTTVTVEALTEAAVATGVVGHSEAKLAVEKINQQMGMAIPTREQAENKLSLAELGVTSANVFNGAVKGGKFVAKAAVVGGTILLTFYIGMKLYQAIFFEDGDVLIDDSL